MLDNVNDKEKLYSDPHEFYNNENILTEEILDEHEEINNSELYNIKTVKITYENGRSVIVTKKTINNNDANSMIN